ncbi:uncharacterized protein LOC132947352 isoform X2 [Metopolophium dirhodum]|uniref:uncharacterized protein LOC132947352 isoform X2 n=1 Tax=Metopolophium dirhodum TaxID=44670 RepID=UPI00298F5C67|nr:uncharacterized protein LOC132947352 isoform X2 [Metopolophium dirhodum]
MNRLLIVLVIAFVSYSLGAPENIESHSADINHDLEHSSDHELEKQNGYRDGNVNSDQSTSENPIDEDRGCVGYNYYSDGWYTDHEVMCRKYCKKACVSGSETSECLKCMTKCLH